MFNEKNTVQVDFETMERLVRDSERLSMVKNYVANEKYVPARELRVLLEIEEEGGEQ